MNWFYEMEQYFVCSFKNKSPIDRSRLQMYVSACALCKRAITRPYVLRAIAQELGSDRRVGRSEINRITDGWDKTGIQELLKNLVMSGAAVSDSTFSAVADAIDIDGMKKSTISKLWYEIPEEERARVQDLKKTEPIDKEGHDLMVRFGLYEDLGRKLKVIPK
jgi:hypothetical protein